MRRALAVTALLVVLAVAAPAQEPGVLHIKVTLSDADGKPTPVPRHTLLISDNPTTAAPRVVVTASDGTATVRLRPGNYTVESDQPVVFQRKAYQWTQMLDIVAGREVVLDLTNANVEVVPVAAATPAAAAREPDLAMLARWQDSVVGIWTPTTHASGFLVDAAGLVATNQRGIGTAASVEVQIAPALKVPAALVVADAARDVAVLRIDPAVAASLKVISLGCGQPIAIRRSGQELVTIGAPLRQQKGPAFGAVTRLDAHAITTDFVLPAGSAGGPVFTTDGAVVGMTSFDEQKADERRQNERVVIVSDVCEVVALAEKKGGTAPAGTHLPVEPATPLPEDVLQQSAQNHARNAAAYQMSSSDFDVTFITPVLAYAAQASDRTGAAAARQPQQRFDQSLVISDFGNWSEYVGDLPPVVLVRVTPKLVEGFWAKVGRGAAMTQGATLPPLKHPKSGFSRLQAFCGDAEVTPIHPFKIEHRISDTDAIDEGLYVFEPGALTPSCGTVKLVLFSAKEPGKADPRIVPATILERVREDFAAYRALK